ncbi:hypothetical protein [Hoeflea sp.]|uniref:hypothetical protein n=1 Tax=Hoeflea sp. TaxID=1940281 RepID=UPI0037478F60
MHTDAAHLDAEPDRGLAGSGWLRYETDTGNSGEGRVTNQWLKGRTAWVRIICALALLMVAFAHQPPAVSVKLPAYAGVDFAEYILPDGTLPDLCLTGEDHGSHHGKSNHCEACRISASADLPLPFSDVSLDCRLFASKPAFPENVSFVAVALRPGASPRAPPVLHA